MCWNIPTIVPSEMRKSIHDWQAMSDPAILEFLGKYIRQARLQQNKTQQQIAIAAGINRSTLVQIENGGGGTLMSFVQILRALGQLQMLEHFEVNPQISPLQLAKLEQNKRQRASVKKGSQQIKPKSDW